MVTLFVMSMERYSGKTAVCLGLARKMASDGLSVGYFKPLSIAIKRTEGLDVDASLMRRSLGLTESLDVLAPVTIDGPALDRLFAEKLDDPRVKIAEAFKTVSEGRDVVMVEGQNGLAEGSMVGLDNQSMAELLDARCLLVIRSNTELLADDVLAVKKNLGNRLLGVVLNAVPRGMLEFVTESLTPFIRRRGVKVYAILPEDKMLMAATVGELVDRLGGRVVTGQDRMNELVENVMVGAMSVENALNYFRRRPNKVVITGGDRADIQLAALQTSTKALVLTGNLYPDSIILSRATEVGVPIILARMDTMSAVKTVETMMGRIRLSHPRQVGRLVDLASQGIDLQALRQAVGL